MQPSNVACPSTCRDRHSKLEYLRAFKATSEAIKIAGGYAGRSIATAQLVAKEKRLEYNTLESVKQAVITEEASTRYLVALVLTGINSEQHKTLKLDLKHN